MQHSNDNLDELFQKAAEDYPLKTDNRDWNNLASRLHKTIVPVPETKQTRKWQYAALLLILLAAGGFFIINNSLTTKSNSKNADKQQTSLNNKKENETGDQKNQPVNSPGNKIKADQSSQAEKSSEYTLKNFNKIDFANPAQSLPDIDESNVSENQLNDQAEVAVPENKQEIGLNPVKNNNSNNSNISLQDSENVIGQNTNNQENKNNSSTESSQRINLTSRTKTFYGSLFVSPEFSTVKFQHINKVGYKIGVSLGYRINDRFSIEAGLQREYKNFYSDGKYFDRSNLKLKSSTKIQRVNGDIKLTNMTVALRYNLYSKNNDHFFATAGVSGVVLTHAEKYDYAVKAGGATDNVFKDFNSLTGAKYFSGINASVGYETPLLNWCNLKVEPYYQTPTKGLGIGNLPVSSFGINVGIVKDLK